MITIDEAIRRLAPDIVPECDELERKIDKAIRSMEPGPNAHAQIHVRSDTDRRVVAVTCRKFERAGWVVRWYYARRGGFDIDISLDPADDASIW